ncbi:MAG TPA: ABC transporter permease [Pirellulaceae bacterium]|nr:ABC transporter permease [Pirellulaceae bacterium]
MSAAVHDHARSQAGRGTHERSTMTLTRPSPWLATGILAWREILRFFRQRNRVVGAIGQPILFWLLFGAGLNRSFRLGTDQLPGTSFQEYYLPGSLLLILLFTAIFATISIIEDRREGLLQAVLIAPCPRWSMVLGKVLGGTFIAMFQGLIFLALALLLQQIVISLAALAGLVLLMFVASVALTSLGVVIAWRMESTQGFHAIMSLVLLPMWLLSGAFFPVPLLDAKSSFGEIGLQWVMRLNPLTYAVAAARHLISAEVPWAQLCWTPAPATCWAVTGCFAVITFVAAWWLAGQRTRGDAI